MIRKIDNQTAGAALPGNLSHVALFAAETCAAIGDMSVSWWLEEVRARRAPQPVIRKPRCTRWRLADVVEFWKKFAEQTDQCAADALMATAKKASAAAQVKRKAKATQAAAAQ